VKQRDRRQLLDEAESSTVLDFLTVVALAGFVFAIFVLFVTG
jgi:hypothetical protein